jgi:hypothetical protein
VTDRDGMWRVALFYCALTVVLTWPLAPRAHEATLPVSPDTQLFIWTLAWDTHAVIHQPFAIFDSNIYYPERRTLAYSENLLGSTIFAAPVLWASGNPLLAMNVVALLSVVLGGLGAYLLAVRLGMRRDAAILAGAVFAFAPARLFRISQLHLTTIQWVPFTLAFLHTYLDSRRPRDLRLAIAFFTLQVLTSGHGAVFIIVAAAALIVYRLFFASLSSASRILPAEAGSHPKSRAPSPESRAPSSIVSLMKDVGLTGILLLVPAAVIAIPYHRVQVEMGLKRPLANWETVPVSFLASPTDLHMWIASLFTETKLGDVASAFLFPGIVPLVLAAVGLMTGIKRPLRTNAALFYGLLTLLAYLLSAGPPLGLWPLVYWLPGFNFLRVPSRFILLAVLGLGILSGIAFERLTATASTKARRIAIAVVGLLFAIECVSLPVPLDTYRVNIPDADRWLATQPKPFVVAEMPVFPSERYQTAYMLHSMAHWQKTVHGYSGMRPALHEVLFREMRRFPDEASIAHLLQLGVRYIVVHPDMYPPDDWKVVEPRLAQTDRRLTLKYSGPGGRVYALSSPDP